MSRMDGRSPEEFKKDIKESTKDQEVILQLWLNKTGQSELRVWDNGSNNTGKYIKNDKEVTTDPDYYIQGLGLIEVQYAKPFCKDYFHIKTNKAKTCIQKQAKILMINGFREQQPEYILITASQIKVICARCSIVNWWHGGGGKYAYQVPISWFTWEKLK